MSSQPKPNSARILTDTRIIIKQEQQAWAATPRTFTSCQVSKGRLHPCQLSDLRNTDRNKSSLRRLWEVQSQINTTVQQCARRRKSCLAQRGDVARGPLATRSTTFAVAASAITFGTSELCDSSLAACNYGTAPDYKTRIPCIRMRSQATESSNSNASIPRSTSEGQLEARSFETSLTEGRI
jgi:hypothetical protein